MFRFRNICSLNQLRTQNLKIQIATNQSLFLSLWNACYRESHSGYYALCFFPETELTLRNSKSSLHF